MVFTKVRPVMAKSTAKASITSKMETSMREKCTRE